MPNGLRETTAEGIESHFAVQVLNGSLKLLLASSGVLQDTSVSIMDTGGKETEFNLDDIELTSSKDAGRYAQIGKQVARDRVVTDTYTKVLQSKFPQISSSSTSPPALSRRTSWSTRACHSHYGSS